MMKTTILRATVLIGGLLCGADAFAQDAAAYDLPSNLYSEARERLAKSDYPAAEAAFRDFLAKHGTHALAGDAQYWLGEIFLEQRDYRQAAATFADAIKTYPDSLKVVDSKYKLGVSLARLDSKQEACKALKAAQADRGSEGKDRIRRGIAVERQRLGCR
ncbi:MAG TPA: tetratricopeptide repeat protein [Azospirillum sp.]